MGDSYLTLGKSASAEFTVNRSRFIGYAMPLSSQQSAAEFIESIRTKHWDATHNVYAYILSEGQVMRYSDDGEPQGTAGVPALEVLRKEGLTDCAVVVTRYFGGILLGAGGLVRAYSHSAKIAVDAAGIVRMTLCGIFTVECDYSFYGCMPSLIAQYGGKICDTAFADSVRLTVSLPADKDKVFGDCLTDKSRGRVFAVKCGEKYDIAD